MAVNRRQKENDTFSDIAHTLPIEENAKELDKASILRIAIHYLRLRDVLADCEPETSPESFDDDNLCSSLPNFSKDVLQALDGFMLLVSKEGKVLFTSESISQYLGLRQVDVIGIDLRDIIHPQDYMDVSAIFQSQGHDVGPEMEMESVDNNHLRRNFVVRMRCAFTPSVRSVTRCSNFKPIYCSAFLKFSSKKVKEGEFLGMVMLCKLASAMKVKELCVGAYFKTKHSLDLSYTAIDTRIRWILGFDPAKMVGAKAYDYFHPEDLLATASCHTNLLSQGHSHSPCYRFMSQNGDWVWVRSKSCVTYDPITHHPNGLSIYTWIVRFDEDDERMRAIMEGRDPGNMGIKDMSKLTLPLNMNIKDLCNPTPVVSSANTRAAKAPSMTSSNPQSYTSPNPQSYTSSNPQSYTSPNPQSYTSSNPQSYTSPNPQSYTSPNPQSYTSSSPQSYTSLSPPNNESSPTSVSPESFPAPPNVNPFQATKMETSLPVCSSVNSSYDISSPKAFVGDPFMGVSMSSFGANVDYNNQQMGEVVQQQPCRYKLGSIKQSSTDSLKDTSPPYTTSSKCTVYTYSTPSPDAVSSPVAEGSSSLTSNYQHQRPYNMDLQQATPIIGTQQYGGHSPYDSYGGTSPYSTDSNSSGVGFVSSPPQSKVGGVDSFAVEATTMYLPASNSNGYHEPPGIVDFRYAAQNIKQEPVLYDSQYYGNGHPSAFMPEYQPTGPLHKTSRNDSYVSQAKARYSSVAVAGKKFHGHNKTQQEDAAILDISQWLQQGRTPVH